jgi:hypothetical protein
VTARRAAVWLTTWPAAMMLGFGGAIVMAMFAANLPAAAISLALCPIVVPSMIWYVSRRVAAHPDAELLRVPFWAGVVARILAVGAQLAIGFIIYRGQVDFVGYLEHATEFIDRVLVDGRFDLLLDPDFVNYYFATRSMFILAMIVAFLMLLVGPHIVAVFLFGVPVAAAAAFIYYRAFQSFAPDEASKRRFAVYIFLFPSLVFWSVFLGKDVWVFFFMATTTLAVAQLLQQIRIRTILALVGSMTVIMIMRPHVGGTLLLSMVLVLALRPVKVKGPILVLRPLLQSGVIAILFVAFTAVAGSALGNIGVKALTMDALAERAFLAHKGFANTEGGSALPIAIETNDPTAVALFIPLGVTTLLFRPFVWEAHNAMAFAAGIENLVLLGLVLWRLPSIFRGVLMIRRTPMVAFVLLAFTTTAIVLAFDWNLGATQRHRTMVLPYLFMLMALPSRRTRAPEPAAA